MQAALGANHMGSVEKRRQLRVHWVAERKKPPRQTARRLSSAKRSNQEVGLVEDHIVELKATAKANRRVQFGYGLNYLIDIENAVIVDGEATPAGPTTRWRPRRP